MQCREWDSSYFFTGFNGPTDPGFALSANPSNSSDPLTLSQATKRPDWNIWGASIQEELKSLEAFDTFEVVDLPFSKHPVGCKCVFKTKFKSDGSLDKCNARLVAQGFLKREGVDYNC